MNIVAKPGDRVRLTEVNPGAEGICGSVSPMGITAQISPQDPHIAEEVRTGQYLVTPRGYVALFLNHGEYEIFGRTVFSS